MQLSLLRQAPPRFIRFIWGCSRRVVLSALALTVLFASYTSEANASVAPPALLETLTEQQPSTDGDLPLLGPGAGDDSSTSALDSARLLLPDLRTLPPSDMKVRTGSGGKRLLRLSNTIWNAGEGPLELSGKYVPNLRRTLVTQRVPTRGGEYLEHRIGEFVYHPTHNHWHFEGFTIYELWSLHPDAALHQVVSSSDKLSYCVIDTDRTDPSRPGYLPNKRYHSCNQKYQGLSIGWGDTYESHLDGQSLDLEGVPDGFYALRSTANPDRALLESSYSNNHASVYLHIRGDHLKLVSPEEIVEAGCPINGWC